MISNRIHFAFSTIAQVWAAESNDNDVIEMGGIAFSTIAPVWTAESAAKVHLSAGRL